MTPAGADDEGLIRALGLGSAVLFGVEEYKLPEFRVSVSTPEGNGKKKQYRLGDTVEANIEARYYFGGPVANATVDVLVVEAPYTRSWSPWHEYPWCYDANDYRATTQARHETLTTDANGHAKVEIKLPDYFVGQPLEKGNALVKVEVKLTDTAICPMPVSERTRLATLKARVSTCSSRPFRELPALALA